MHKPNWSLLGRLLRRSAPRHDIHWAVERLHAGKAVRRAGWFSGEYVTRCHTCDGVRYHEPGADYEEHWVSGLADLTATDWEEAKP